MADMADIDQVEECWDALADALGVDPEQRVMPVTYMNSSAALKAFCGRHGGIVCTSSECARGAGVGVRAAAAGPVLPRPAPRPQHRQGDGHSARPDGPVAAQAGPSGGVDAGRSRRGARDPVGGPLLGARDLPARARRSDPRRAAEHPDPGASRVPDGGRRQGRRRGLDREDQARRSRRRPRAASGRSAPRSTW